jgi:Ca2+-binding RTX toxin-like protein
MRRNRFTRWLALAGVTAGSALAGAPAAQADTDVSLRNGNFGTGANGLVLHVRDRLTPAHDERMNVRVTTFGTFLRVEDLAGNVVASGPSCQQVSARVATCDGFGVDGIRFDGTQFDDVLNNDSGFSSHMIGAAGNDQLDGGTINDVMVSDAGNETVAGQAGIDTVVYGTPAGSAVVVTLDDLANDGTSSENDNVRTSTENVVGTPHDDVLVGSDVANQLNGLGGRDHLEGHGGDDTFNESPLPSGADDMRGGAGTDLVTYAGRPAGVRVTLDNLANDGSGAADAFPFGNTAGDNVRSDVENVRGTDHGDVITGNLAANAITAQGGNDTVDGQAGNDALAGGAGLDDLRGGAGADALEGGTENDRLDGGLGGDRIDGQAGVDFGDYSLRTDPVSVTLAGTNGDDGDVTDGPAGQRDSLVSVEKVTTGTGRDSLIGGPADETLNPGPANDRVFAEAGADVLVTNDGESDVIGCGEGPVEPPASPETRDRLTADVPDLIYPINQGRLAECELIVAGAVNGPLQPVLLLPGEIQIGPQRIPRPPLP